MNTKVKEIALLRKYFSLKPKSDEQLNNRPRTIEENGSHLENGWTEFGFGNYSQILRSRAFIQVQT